METNLNEKYSAEFEKLRELLNNSKYIVFYSGAGVSASAGIGTFTGENAMGSLLDLREDKLDLKMPTYSHFAITRMIEAGIVKFVVSSNHDNLHRRSGTKNENIAELFGNAYVEICLKCKKNYQRTVICPPTSRYCDDLDCKGKLIKSGVRYGQETPQQPLTEGLKHSSLADLSIVLGSSMGTSPFCDMPPLAKKMVLCNLKPTRYDKKAALAFQMNCDDFMRKVIQMTNIKMGIYTYTQPYDFGYTITGETLKFFLRGHHPNEPCTCVDSITITGANGISKELDQSNITKNFETEFRLPPKNESYKVKIDYKSEYEVEALSFDQMVNIDLKDSVNTFLFKKEVDYS